MLAVANQLCIVGGGKQFKIVGEGSGLYIKQTLVTPEDQSLNQLGENFSLTGSSK